jgi:hypothetical protein
MMKITEQKKYEKSGIRKKAVGGNSFLKRPRAKPSSA